MNEEVNLGKIIENYNYYGNDHCYTIDSISIPRIWNKELVKVREPNRREPSLNVIETLVPATLDRRTTPARGMKLKWFAISYSTRPARYQSKEKGK